MTKNRPKPFVDQVIDAAFVAPAGVAAVLRLGLPELVERSREQVGGKIAMARFVGKLAVQQGQSQVRKRVETKAAASTAEAPTARRPTLTAVPDPPPTATIVPEPIEPDAPTVAPTELAISDFDSLAAAQVVARLPGLSAPELDLVEEYERTHRRRRTVLGRIAQLKDAG